MESFTNMSFSMSVYSYFNSLTKVYWSWSMQMIEVCTRLVQWPCGLNPAWSSLKGFLTVFVHIRFVPHTNLIRTEAYSIICLCWTILFVHISESNNWVKLWMLFWQALLLQWVEITYPRIGIFRITHMYQVLVIM